MSIRRALPFLLLNILISASTVLAILYYWNYRNQARLGELVAIQQPVVPATLVPASAETTLAPLDETAEGEVAGEATPAPTATSVADTYVVQAGDTLDQISRQFGISMQEIMEANGIANPNFINLGQELIIPVNGIIPTPGPTEPAAASTSDQAPPTPIPTDSLGSGEVVIEIRELTGLGDVAEERIQIVNSGTRAIDLAGWELRGDGSNIYRFGQFTLFGEGAGVWLNSGSASGTRSPSNLYWGHESSQWSPGEVITLFDAEGTEQAVFVVP